MTRRPRLVVMAGGTASGKTTLAQALAERMDLLLLNHDRYYRDIPDPASADFDHPDSLETDLLVQHVDELLAGRPAQLPVYEFRHHRRAAQTERAEPRPIILVEGILTLHHPGLADRADLSVFVHAEPDVRLARRVLRDIAARGRSPESVIDRYLGMVRPAHQEFIEPSRQRASLVLDGGGSFDAALAELQAAVASLKTGT